MFKLSSSDGLSKVQAIAAETLADGDLPAKYLSRDVLLSILRRTPIGQFSFEHKISPILLAPYFPQWDEKEEVRISFFDSERALLADRRTCTTLGRFINMFDLQLSLDRVIDYVRSQVVKQEVKFAITAHDIGVVYHCGPNSCMSGDKGIWLGNNIDSIFVPSIYAYPLDRTDIVPESGNSLAVAYFGNIDSDAGPRKVTARALCDLSRRTFNRIYGDTQVMYRRLLDMGFTQNKDLLLGIPLSKVKDGSITLCPYLDAKITDRVALPRGKDYIKLSTDGHYKFGVSKYLTRER